MFTFVVLRLDVLLLELIRGAGEVGVYVVAVSLAEFVFLPASTTATLLFPRLTAMADGRGRWLLALRERSLPPRAYRWWQRSLLSRRTSLFRPCTAPRSLVPWSLS